MAKLLNSELSPQSELILGIDPGSIKTGFGILELRHDGRIIHVSHGTIVLDPKMPISERIQHLAQDLTQIVKKYQPHRAAVEDVFFCENARSALVLGQARGAILAILGIHGINIKALSPTAVKAMVVGHGRAQKYQVAQMVALELNIAIPTSSDAADALGIALALARHVRV